MAFSAIVRSPFGVLAAVALLAVACGGSPAPAPASGNSVLAKLEDYAKCMRSHGIKDFPDPVADPSGQGGGFNLNGGPGSDLNHNDPRFQAADQACQSLMPQPAVPPAQRIAGEAKLAACMRTHGFPNFPDPDSSGGFDSSKFDTQLQSAMRTCRQQTGFTEPIGVHPSRGN